jgi:hypothetical protein
VFGPRTRRDEEPAAPRPPSEPDVTLDEPGPDRS